MVLVAEALLLKADNTAWFSTPWRHALEGLREAPPPGPVDQWRAIGSVFCSMLNTQLPPVNNFNSMTVTFVYNDINISVRFDRWRVQGCPFDCLSLSGDGKKRAAAKTTLLTLTTYLLSTLSLWTYHRRKCTTSFVVGKISCNHAWISCLRYKCFWLNKTKLKADMKILKINPYNFFNFTVGFNCSNYKHILHELNGIIFSRT